jgi:hypothetical protein
MENWFPKCSTTCGSATISHVGIAAGIAAAGAAVGIGVYFALKHNHNLTGCALSSAEGMTLTSESDKETYALIGDVADIKSGDRVRISGKKGKPKSAGGRQFLVEKVSRHFGPCAAGSQVM